MMNLDKHFKDLDDLEIYMDYVITNLGINAYIDSTRVNKHPLHYYTLQEFQNAIVNTSKRVDDNLLDHWKNIINSRN